MEKQKFKCPVCSEEVKIHNFEIIDGETGVRAECAEHGIYTIKASEASKQKEQMSLFGV